LKVLDELTGKDRGKTGIGNLPYKDLYIYIFKGPVNKNDEAGFGDAFIGNWLEADSSFLFFAEPAVNEVNRLLKACPELEMMESHHFTYEQWQGGGLQTFRINDFMIVPPWEEKDASEEGIVILLDPGVVFGNGLHPTTRDCLKALAYTRKESPFTRVLDLGTGTGILALAAGLLGAERVLAVDINPLCVKTANNNTAINGLTGVVQVAEGPAEDFVHEQADLVVANIHHAVIKGLLDRGGFRHTERFIISGLLRSQFRDIRMHLERNCFQIIREWDQEMTWYTLDLVYASCGKEK